ncbi:MAG: glycosyltransferase family 39 protein, partial [Microlunatus sp.]|nr:glycosyltransferase family 39 protein [Microlunatus sp.]
MAGPDRPGSGFRLPVGSYLAAGAVVLLLMLVASRYGYHRDEYYFIESGHHPAWAQPDNPMLVPYLAAGWNTVVGGRLWAFRILPALFAAGYVLVAGLIAGELGGRPRHQVAASVATALTGMVLATGHLFSTETFDMTVSAAALWLLIMAVRTDRWGPWLAAGIATGVAMEIRMMAIFVIASCLLAMLIIGPRRVLAGAKVWVSAAAALLLAAPNLIWQAVNGWPMRSIASNIAAGGSTSSTARIAVLPSQLLIIGPIICVVLITGVVWLWRSDRRRRFGWLSLGYLIFLAVVVITGGKSYYPSPF